MPQMRVTFHEELDAMCAEIQKEGELVLRSLRAALNALEHDDVELADEVISFDDEIDRMYADIERGIESLLADYLRHSMLRRETNIPLSTLMRDLRALLDSTTR